MGDQTDAGNIEEPFAFQPTSLPFELPEVQRAHRDAPRPDALDFDALTVAPDQRRVTTRSRFDRPEDASPHDETAAATVTNADMTRSVVAPEITTTKPGDGDGQSVETGERHLETSAASGKIGDFDPDSSLTGGTSKGVFAMAGVACVALFMTAVALVGPNSGTTTAPAELARRENPVSVRSGVADQAFEHTIARHELAGESVKPIVLDACSRLGDGDEAADVEAGARDQLLALSPTLTADAIGDIVEAGIESHCMEHLLTVLSE